MTGQITTTVQDVDYDNLVWLVQKDQKMLPGPNEPQVIGIIQQDCTTPAMRLSGYALGRSEFLCSD